jgi:hypothetical protein
MNESATTGGPDSGAELPLPDEFFDPDAVPVSGGLREERLLVPGVYFTPGVAKSDATTGVAAQPDGEDSYTEPQYTNVATLSRDELVHQEREVAKTVAKLKESNHEMLNFDPESKDEDLVQARKENDVTVRRAEERLDMMRRRLNYLDPLDHAKP